MKVILIQDVDRLGKLGDVISVKEGYARNYLIPNNKARQATGGNLKMLEALKKKRAAGEAAKLKDAEALAAKIAALSVTITAQVGEEEKLFGSVSSDMIREALLQEGVNVDKKDIMLDEQIKKLGVYSVHIKIHPEIKATLKVWVVKS